MRQIMVHEIFEQLAAKKTRDEKILLLRQYNSPALREILKYAFYPGLKFFTNTVQLPVTDAVPEGMSFNTLFNEYRRLYVLTEQSVEFALSGKRTSLPRKQNILDQIMENIHPRECVILKSLVEGTFAKNYGVNRKLIEDALPQVFQ